MRKTCSHTLIHFFLFAPALHSSRQASRARFYVNVVTVREMSEHGEIGDAFRRARASTPALGKGRRVAVSPCRRVALDRPTVRPSDRPTDRPIAFRSF